MTSQEAQSIAVLEARWRHCHEATSLLREMLIEALGDFLCGSGSGPSLEAIREFEAAQSVEVLTLQALDKLRAKIKG